jgi:hypothetical protein
MTISLDTEIVASSYNPITRICTYTIERDGRRWTAEVHIDHLEAHGHGPIGAKKRQTHIANALTSAMRGPHDRQPSGG